VALMLRSIEPEVDVDELELLLELDELEEELDEELEELGAPICTVNVCVLCAPQSLVCVTVVVQASRVYTLLMRVALFGAITPAQPVSHCQEPPVSGRGPRSA
jgi:hypothetical protein